MDRLSQPFSPGLLTVTGVADLELVGRGGFARVYRGWQAEMRRHVAVKVLDGVVDDPDSARRFRREVAAMGAASHHPNVVPVYATGVTDDGHPYLIMPFYSGGTLNERLMEGPLDPVAVSSMGAKVAAALEAAHETGVLHRDVKPSNILFSAYGEPLLADFGIARLADSTLTNSNVVAATIAYAAPESLSGQHVGPVADVYSLGATLYAALAGVPPFVIGPDETLAAFVARAVTQPPADLPPSVSTELAAAIERAMAKEPGLRTASAARFEEDLAACHRAGATVALVAPPPGAEAEAPPTPRADPLPTAPAHPLPAAPAAPPVAPPASTARSDGATATSAADGAAVPLAEAALVSGGEAESGGSGEGVNRRRRAWAAVAAAVLAVLVVGLIAYRSQTSTKPKAAPSSPSAPSTARASTAPASTAPPATSAPTTARPSTAPSTTAPPPATSTPTTVRAVVPISPPSVPSTTTPTSPPSAPAGGTPGAATIPDTVNRYYSLLPTGAVQDGFQWLSPAYRQRVGFDTYRAFWGSIKTVDVVDVVPQDSNSALVSLRYNGAPSNERHLLTFVRDPNTGNFLIDTYQ